MKVGFVLDYRSIYSYLANSQVQTLGAPIEYRVVDIGAVMKAVNNQPSPLCPPKLKYAHIDAARWAQIYGVPLTPNAALLSAMKEGVLKRALLSRAALAAQRLGIFDRVNGALFDAVWAGSDDLATEDGRFRFAADRAIPRALWELADSPEVAAELAANNERAIADGVFGVPTFFVNQEMFFGNDRLLFVKERLANSTGGPNR